MVTTATGFVFEFFVSNLTEAIPLLATETEQCRDNGFELFGVFKNQGDCISFVTTHGKNEAGQNVP